MITEFLSLMTQFSRLEVTIPKPTNLPNPEATEILDGSLNLIFIVLGGISLLVLVLQGMKYALSSGNEEKTAQARNGIIYAFVGISIALAAGSLVNFTLEEVVQPATTTVGETVDETGSVVELFADIASYMILITAFISIIVIVVGGLRLLFSEGNSEKARKARNTIIYAVVGLIVTIVASPTLHLFLEILRD